MTDAVPSMQPVARLRGRTPATSRQKSPISTVYIFTFFTFNRVFLVGEKRIFILCRLSCRFCFFGFDFFWFDPKNTRCWYWSCDSGFQLTILSSYWKLKRNYRLVKNIYSRFNFYAHVDLYPRELGIFENPGIYIPVDERFSEIWGFLSRGLGIFQSLGILSPRLRIFENLGIFYPLDFFWMGIFWGWEFFSWDGISL